MALQLNKLGNGSITPDYTLADAQREYKIKIGSTITTIPKPKNWEGLDIKFKRDRKWHGFTPETSDEALITFYANEGREIILAEYNLKGQDAEIIFQEYAKDLSGNSILENEYLIDLNKLKVKGNEINVAINKKSIEQLVASRWDTKINMSSDETLDGYSTAVGSMIPDVTNVSLHSKAISYQYQNIRNEPIIVSWQEQISVSQNYYIQLDTNDPQINQIPNHYGYDLGVSTLYPPIYSKYNFVIQDSGYYNFDLSVQFQFNIELLRANISLPIDIGVWSLKFYLVCNGSFYEFSGSQSGTSNDSILGEKTFTGTKILNDVYLSSGTTIYIYGHFNFSPSRNNWRGSLINLKNLSTNYSVDCITTVKNSNTYGLTPEKSAKFLLYCITNGDAEFKSNYFSDSLEGCGSKRLLLNGQMIRLQGVSPLPSILPYPTFSLRDWMISFQAIDGVGFGYEVNSTNGKDIFRVEKYDYFYQDVEIMRIEGIDWNSYEEEPATDFIYNKIKIGYEKYASEGSQVLDEFNTEHEYQTPIKTFDNEFTQKSVFSTSGYAIEAQRRLIYSQEQKTSGSDDDTNFVISVVKTSIASSENHTLSFKEPYQFEYDEELNQMIPIDPMNTFLVSTASNFWKAGGTISITGSTYNNGTFDIVYVEFLSYLNKYLVQLDGVLTQELNVNVTISALSIPLAAEKNEFFNITSGTLIDPSSSYNLRFNPKYMLQNHMKLINSGLKYKGAGEKIQCTSVIQNTNLTIQRKTTDTCNATDPNRISFSMGDDILLSELNSQGRFFRPELIKFQTIMMPEQIRYIVNAHKGLSTNNDNYGYFTVVNIYNEEIECYLLDLSYNKKNNVANFTFVKKNS